jgi:hypothetical protein
MAKTSSFLTKEDRWISEHFEELVDTYAGRYVAVVGEKVVSVGSTLRKVSDEARKKYPSRQPTILPVPRPQDFISVLIIDL